MMPFTQIEKQYLELVNEILTETHYVDGAVNRTDVKRHRVFSRMVKFDLRHQFPLLEGKLTHFPSIVRELGWFGNGQTNIDTLGCSIWNEWASDGTGKLPKGDIGPLYGSQWRNAKVVTPADEIITVDQLQGVMDELERDPNSSRLIVMSWNPGQLPKSGMSVQDNLFHGYMGLAPCHFGFQLFHQETKQGHMLDMAWWQRSVDVGLGLPFNIASYATMLKLIAKQKGMTARNLSGWLGDTHIYDNHIEGMKQYVKQTSALIPNEWSPATPVTLDIPDGVTIFNLHENVDAVINSLKGYKPQPHIKLPRN